MRTKIFFILSVIVGAVAVVLVSVPARAVSLKEYDVKTLVAGEKCSNPAGCPGMCTCTLNLNTGLDGRTYTWSAYEFKSNIPLFQVYDEPLFGSGYNYAYTAYFNFDGKNCGVTVDGNAKSVQTAQEQLGNFAGACTYNHPFCCCKRGPDGLLQDCQRSVEYQNGSAVCSPPLSNDYRPFTARSLPQYQQLLDYGAQCATFQETINRAELSRTQPAAVENEKEGPKAVSLDTYKQQAGTLNQTSFAGVQEVVGQLIKIMLAFIGSIGLALYVWAGSLWMTAAGNTERVEKAKQVIVWTTLGIAAMLSSYLIVNFVFVALAIK